MRLQDTLTYGEIKNQNFANQIKDNTRALASLRKCFLGRAKNGDAKDRKDILRGESSRALQTSVWHA
jgi:hypothetical protein